MATAVGSVDRRRPSTSRAVSVYWHRSFLKQQTNRESISRHAVFAIEAPGSPQYFQYSRYAPASLSRLSRANGTFKAASDVGNKEKLKMLKSYETSRCMWSHRTAVDIKLVSYHSLQTMDTVPNNSPVSNLASH